MQIHDVQQGTEEWHKLRREHFTASEAPAMLGVSKYQSRDKLLHEKATGEREEINPYKQKIFDKGHAAEAAARPIVEAIIGDELYPVTGTETVDSLPLLASFDGITMGHNIGFEHKLWNDDLAETVEMDSIEEHYLVQLEQQLMVSGADKIVFTVSDGTSDKMVRREYVSDPKRRAKIIAGWHRFKQDLENYQAPEVEKPAPTATAIMELPALVFDIEGKVKSTNLAIYEETATDFIKKINTDLQTDQDFVDADKAAKFCREAAKKLELVKQQALAKTADIDAIFKSIDKMVGDFNAKGLQLEKLVKSEKDKRKAEAIAEGKKQVEAYVAEQNAKFNREYIWFTADFVTATKGLKTIESVRSRVNDEVARAKIEIDNMTSIIMANVKTLTELAADYKTLFPDVMDLIHKDAGDFEAIVKARIADHLVAEKEKEEKAKLAGEAQQKAAEQREAMTNSATTQVPDDSDRTMTGFSKPADDHPTYLNFRKGETREYSLDNGLSIKGYTIDSDFEQDGQTSTIKNFITVKDSEEMRDFILEHLQRLELK